jgi:glutaminase
MDYSPVLLEIQKEIKPLIGKGKVADYIPALASISPDKFGMAVTTIDGSVYTVGDVSEPFSIQSISKVFTLTLAFKYVGERLWNRVGKEPSGNPFNSLVQLEYENGIPRNPFINAGALVIADTIISNSKNALSTILDFIHSVSGNRQITYDRKISDSEKRYGNRNAALAYFMKSFGNVINQIDQVLDLYFHQCAITMNCIDLSRSFLYLANHGVNPLNDERLITVSESKRISSLMLTCGLYDESGDFAFLAGLPGKSGVGGGIVAIIPGQLSLAVWSPALNRHGNSMAGIKALELFTTKTGISIF